MYLKVVVVAGGCCSNVQKRYLSSQNSSALLKKYINSAEVVIFSKSDCGYSGMAREMFNRIGQRFANYELDMINEGTMLLDELERQYGDRMVPKVFVRGKLIGGGNDVKELFRSGKLAEMFKK